MPSEPGDPEAKQGDFWTKCPEVPRGMVSLQRQQKILVPTPGSGIYG
jgi:hypothetical protein